MLLCMVVIFSCIGMCPAFWGQSTFRPHELNRLKENDTIPGTLVNWETIDAPRKVSFLSMHVDHNSDGPWTIPSQYDKHGIGYNRTLAFDGLERPHACAIRFYGIALEKTLEGFIEGGSGYMQLSYSTKNGRMEYQGNENNDAIRIFCYYMTNRNFGSEFVDTPKTLGVALTCPITMDMEIGKYDFRATMVPGYFCRNVAEQKTKIELFLRPSAYGTDPSFKVSRSNELESSMVAFPQAVRKQFIKELMAEDPRPHAVCTVQTFRNPQSGPLLYMFVVYYIKMGWTVIVYDRFGYHREFVEELLHWSGFHYHPYTVFQLAQPDKYNDAYARSQGFDMKTFYKMERNWGYKGKLADTADQDQDKTKTYDFCRVEYAHLDLILFLDADELFYCPQASKDVGSQRKYQQRIMGEYSSLGVEEMRFVRIPYSGLCPPGVRPENRSKTDFTNHTSTCMQQAYESRQLIDMFKCWSSGSAYDNFPKSGDFASKCPFHYNHWSCDGGRAGGRDAWGHAKKCRCKVSLDMNNGYAFKPVLDKCHLLHFNDNKYRFQSNRDKGNADKGDVTQFSPPVAMLAGSGVNKHAQLPLHHRDREKERDRTSHGVAAGAGPGPGSVYRRPMSVGEGQGSSGGMGAGSNAHLRGHGRPQHPHYHKHRHKEMSLRIKEEHA